MYLKISEEKFEVKNFMARLDKNMSKDGWLTCETKAFLLHFLQKKTNTLKRAYIFDGPQSFLVFLKTMKHYVIKNNLIEYRIQFILTVGGRSHDISGDIRVIKYGVLDYAVILDPNTDDENINLTVDMIIKVFKKIQGNIITNGFTQSKIKNKATMPQQKYGLLCSVYCIDNIVKFSKVDASHLFKCFFSKSIQKNKETERIRILQPNGLPALFAQHAQFPGEFKSSYEELIPVDGKMITLKEYYSSTSYNIRKTYSKGNLEVSISIEQLKEKFKCILLSDQNFLYNINLEQYRYIMNEKCGINFCWKHFTLSASPVSKLYIDNNNKFILEVPSTYSIGRYRIGDIGAFYDLKKIIEENSKFTKAEKTKAIAQLKIKIFSIKSGKFRSNIFLKNTRKYLDRKIGSDRSLIIDTWLNHLIFINYVFIDNKTRRYSGSKVIADYADIHCETPLDPCPDKVILKFNSKAEINELITYILGTEISLLQHVGCKNTLALKVLLRSVKEKIGLRDYQLCLQCKL